MRSLLSTLGLQRPGMAFVCPFHGQRTRREPSESVGRLRAGHSTNSRRVHGCCPMRGAGEYPVDLGERPRGRWKEPRATTFPGNLVSLDFSPKSPSSIEQPEPHATNSTDSCYPSSSCSPSLFSKNIEYDSRIGKRRATALDLRTLFRWMDTGEQLVFAFPVPSSLLDSRS
ncbi:hypothetical protein B0T18DRAFT_422821 [Schizothecium vesticola]|uniref:Uncharacterized protein n=1 Tax=Schizothecium vesticola TaxID=314040 RepID=A0AA40BR92_9PEZI|nr:hypothetical protein B0T18DRAFT_422821 [Schizothecium vesticola]